MAANKEETTVTVQIFFTIPVEHLSDCIDSLKEAIENLNGYGKAIVGKIEAADAIQGKTVVALVRKLIED